MGAAAVNPTKRGPHGKTIGVDGLEVTARVPDSHKASWAVAYASAHRRELGKWCKKAYSPDGPPDLDALRNSIKEARTILAALERALEMAS